MSAPPAEPSAPARRIPALLHVLGVLAASIVFVATATTVSADRSLAAAGHQTTGQRADDVASMPVHATTAASHLTKPASAAPAPLVASGAPASDSALDIRVRAADPSTDAPTPTTKRVRIASGARARAKSWNRKLPPSDNPF